MNMATEADIAEPVAVSLMERGVNRDLNPGGSEHLPEIADFLVKSVRTEVLSNVEAKTTISGFEANPGTIVGVSFSETPSITRVPEEETIEIHETCQADEIPCQSENKTIESEKQVKPDENVRAAEKSGRKESEVLGAAEEVAKMEERTQEISDASEFSSKNDKAEEHEEKTSRVEKTIDQVKVNKQTEEEEGRKESDPNVETQTNACFDNEEKGFDLAQQNEKTESKKDGVRHDRAVKVSSIEAASLQIQNSEDASSAVVHNVEEDLGVSSVTLATDKSSIQQAVVEAVEKLEENLVDETEEKSNVESSAAPQTEEVCLQEVNKAEISKVVSEPGKEDLGQRIQEEEYQTEMVEKTPEAESSGAEIVQDEKNPEQKLASEEVDRNNGKEQAVTVVLLEESKDETRHTIIADEDRETDALTASDRDMDGPENEKIQTSPETISKETDKNGSTEFPEKLIYTKEQTFVRKQEESFDVKEKGQGSTDSEAVRNSGIPSAEDPTPTELHARVEVPEFELPNKNESESKVVHSSEQETVLVEGEELGKVSNFKPGDQIDGTNEAVRDEEEHNKGEMQATDSTKIHSSELASEKGAITTEPSPDARETEIGISEDIQITDSREKLEIIDAENNIEEDIEEACQTEVPNFPTCENTEKCHAEEANVNEVGSTAFLQENIEQTVQAVSVQEEETPSKDEAEQSGKARNATTEEVTGIGNIDNGSNLRDNAVNFSSEVINEETVENYQLNEKEVDTCKVEDMEGISQESVQEEVGTKSLRGDEMDIDKSSTREIDEESEVAEKINSNVNEAKHSDESPDSALQYSLDKEQENLPSQKLTAAQQASSTEEIDEDGGCSIKKEEGKGNEPNENAEQSSNVPSVAAEPSASSPNNDNSVEVAETEKEEILHESNIERLSQETENFQDNDNSAKISSKEFIEESKEEVTGDSIAHETNQNNERPSGELLETSVSAKDDTAIENQEENIDKKEAEAVDVDASRVDEIQKIENVPTAELDEISGKNVDELEEIPSLEQGPREVLDFEPQDQACTENEADRDEEKQDENYSEACKSTKNTSLEHPFSEGAVVTEPRPETSEINNKNWGKVQGLDSEEKLKAEDAERTIKKEACETEMHTLAATTSDESGKCHIEEVTSDNNDNIAISTEPVEQNSQAASLHEEPKKLKDEAEFNKNSRSEEILDIGEVGDEEKKIDKVMHLSPEASDEEKVESTQQSEMKEDICEEEDTNGQNNDSGISQEPTGENPVKIDENDEKTAKQSSNRKILENPAAIGTVDSTTTKAKQSDQGPDIVVIETSSIAKIDEAESSMKKDEDIGKDSALAEVDKRNGVMFKGEDLEQNLQKNETQENTEELPNMVSTEMESSASNQTNNNVVEEFVESPECNEKEIETDKDAEFIDNSNNKSLPQDSVKVEKSNTEIFEKLAADETTDNIVTEAKDSDESPDLVKEHENQQTQNLTVSKGSREDDSSSSEFQDRNVISAETEAGSSSQTNYKAIKEGVESLQFNEREVEIEKDEVLVNESNIEGHSQEEVAEDPIKNFSNDDKNAKKSNIEIYEKSETTETVDGIVIEAKQSDESLLKEQGSQKSSNLTIPEASSIDEDVNSIKKDEDGEKESQAAETEKQNEVILIGKEGMEQKNEPKETIEPSLNKTLENAEASDFNQTDDATMEDGGEKPQSIARDLEIEKDGSFIKTYGDRENDIGLTEIKLKETISKEEEILKLSEKTEQPLESIYAEIEADSSSQINDNIVEQGVAQPQRDEAYEFIAENKYVENSNVEDLEKLQDVDNSILKEAAVNETSEVVDHHSHEMTGEKEILKGQEDLEIVLQKVEPGENLEQSIIVPSTEIETGSLSEVANDTEVSNKEISESKTGESTALVVNQNDENPDASRSVTPIKEEETPQDKNIDTVEASPDEKRENNGSSFHASEDNDNKNKLAEPTENSKKETLNGEDDVRLELQGKEPEELLESSSEVIATEIKAVDFSEKTIDVTIPKELEAFQSVEETLHKKKEDSFEENLESEPHKNEPREGVELSPEVITTETKAGMLNDKDGDVTISDEVVAVQNTKELEGAEKKEGNEDIDESKVEKAPTTEDIKLIDEKCDESTSVKHETVKKRLMTSEIEVEKTEKINQKDQGEKLDLEGLSHESIVEDPAKNFQNDDNNLKKLTTMILEKSETAEKGDNIDESNDLVKEHRGLQIQDLIAAETSVVEDIQKDGSSIQIDGDIENVTGLAKVEQRETILKGEEGLKLSENIEQPLESISAETEEDSSSQLNENNIEEGVAQPQSDEAQESVAENKFVENLNSEGPKNLQDSNNSILKEDSMEETSEIVNHHRYEMTGEKEILKGEEDLEIVLQKVEPGENPEHSTTVLSAEAETSFLSELANDTDVYNKEISEFNTGESIALAMNQNDENLDANQSVTSMKEEENPQDKNIDPVKASPDEKREGDENDGETKLAKSTENSKKEKLNGENDEISELQAKEPEALPESSSDLIATETKAINFSEKADDITIPKELENFQSVGETLQKEKEDSFEENLESELHKNEPGELVESSPEVITTETKASMLNDKDGDVTVSDDSVAVQNTEEPESAEKKEGNEDIDGNKVKKASTTEDIKPADEKRDESTRVENEILKEKSMTSEIEVEKIEKTNQVDLAEKSDLEGIEMKKSEGGINEEDTREIDNSPQTTGEETVLICEGDEAEAKHRVEMHEKFEQTGIVEGSEIQTLMELNVEKDQPAEPKSVSEDVKEMEMKEEMQEIVQSAGDEDTREQIIEKSHKIEDDSQVPLRVQAEGSLQKENEAENDPVKSKEEIKGFALEITKEIAARSDEAPNDFDTLKDKQQPGDVSDEPILLEESNASLIEESSLEPERNEETIRKYAYERETEETNFEEVEQEDDRQLDSYSPNTKEKESTTVDTKEVFPDIADTNAPQDDASNLVENTENDIPVEANKNEQNLARPEYAKVSKVEEPEELVGQKEICKSEAPEDEESQNIANEALNSTGLINADWKEAILEEEDSAKKSEASLKEDNAIEKEAAIVESLTQKQEYEVTEIKNYEILTGEKIEAAESSKKDTSTSEILTRDPSNENIPETESNISKKDIISESVEPQPQEPEESQQETEENREARFEPEDYIKEIPNEDTEIVKTVILTEEAIESRCVSTKDLKVTGLSEETEMPREVQETSTRKEKEEIEVKQEDSEEVIKEQIIEDIESKLEEVRTDDKPVEESNLPAEASNPLAVEALAGEQDRIELEENSTNLASQLPLDGHENVKQENVEVKTAVIAGIVESRNISDVTDESTVHDVKELHTRKIKDETEKASEMAQKYEGHETVARSEVASDQTFPEEMAKEHETTEDSEKNSEKVSIKEDESEDRCLQNEKPRELGVSQLDPDGDKDISESPNEDNEEKVGTLDEIKEVKESSETVSNSKFKDHNAATGDDTNTTIPEEKSEEPYQTESRASPSKEEELGSSTEVEKTEENINGEELLNDEAKTSEEIGWQKEESRELQVSELELDSPNEAQKAAKETSIDAVDKRDASELILESKSEGKGEIKGDEILSFQPIPEEQTSVICESTEEKIKEAEASECKSKVTEETCLQKEEPREIEISLLQFELDKSALQERQNELYATEAWSKEGTKEVSESVPLSSSQENTAESIETSEKQIQTASAALLSVEKSKEQIQTASTVSLSDEQEHGILTIATSKEEKAGEEVPEDAQNLSEEATSQKEEPGELKPSQSEPQFTNAVHKKSLEGLQEAEGGNPDEPVKLQPEHENEKTDAVTTVLVAEENQSERTTDATEVVHTEITKELVKEEKDDAKNYLAITLDEAATKESLQELKLKAEENLADKLLNKEIENEAQCKETEKTDASEMAEKQISIENKAVENPHQGFVQNKTVTEPFPNEGRKLNDEYQGDTDEAISGDRRTDSETATVKELGVETSRKETTTSHVESADSIPDTYQEEKTPEETSENLINRGAEPEAKISTIKEDVLQTLQESVLEIKQVTEAEDLHPENAINNNSELKQHGLQTVVDEDDGKGVKESESKESESKDSAKISLFDMMQRSTRERQAAAELTEEKEQTAAAKEETAKQCEDPEKVKSDEEVEEEEEEEEHEGEDEHRKNDSGSDAPVMVEASRDIDIKVPHKKPHNILSGVGSKVKHSIIKVKKAITGKSSHSKQQSPK